MWPIMLDMTPEECRGILRRLELETYSNLMSSFRAQGCLSDNKIKLLEELRTILHISIDRHRAEARRAANDEELCTIAEALFGPNTGREWSLEGKRPFPLLPRGAAFTALNIVAEKGNDMGGEKNKKLPEPFETRREHLTPSEIDINKKVVLSDPLRFNSDKINLKRSLSVPVETQPTSPAIKKRGDILLQKHQASQHQQHFQQNIQILSQQLQQQTHQTVQQSPQSTSTTTQVHTNSRIQQLYHTHSKTQSRHKRGMVTKRGGKGRTATIRTGGVVGPIGPLPTVPGENNKMEKRIKEKILYPVIKNENNEICGATNIMNIEIPVATPPLQSPTSNTIVEAQQIFIPQIATSKKDIASNLTKLNLNVNNNSSNQNSIPPPAVAITPGANVLHAHPSSHALPQQQQKTMKIIPSSALNIKLANNILQKSLTGKIINTSQFEPGNQSGHVATPTSSSVIPIGSKINLQIQSVAGGAGKSSMVTTNSQIPITLSPSLQPMLTSPKSSLSSSSLASQHIIAAAQSGTNSSDHIGLKMSSQSTSEISNLNVVNKPPKVQIISQQIIHSPNIIKTGGTGPAGINSLTTPIKIAPQSGNQVQLKTISTAAGKNQIKLIPTGGKVLIKSSPSNHKITGITQIKGATGSSTPNNNNITTNFQKVQFMPVKTDGTGKSNVILMQKINQTQVAQGGTIRSVKLAKDMNKIIANATKTVTITPSKLNSTQQSQNFNQNNVIVLGFQDTQQPQQQQQQQQQQHHHHQQTKQSTNNQSLHIVESNKMLGKLNSVITEDTPVDIISSLNSVNVTEEIIINGNLDGAQSTATIADNSKLIASTSAANHQQQQQHDTQIDGATIETITDWEDELDHHTTSMNILKNSPTKKSPTPAAAVIRRGDEPKNKVLLYDLSHDTDEDEEEDDFIEEDHTMVDDDEEDDGVTEDDEDDIVEEDNGDDIIDDDNDDDDHGMIMTMESGDSNSLVQQQHQQNDIYSKAIESANINFGGTYTLSSSCGQQYTKIISPSGGGGGGGTNKLITSDCGGGGDDSGVGKQKCIKNNNNKIVGVDDVEALMIEMHEMDDSSNRKLRNMTINELIASGHIVTTESMVSPEMANGSVDAGDNVSE